RHAGDRGYIRTWHMDPLPAATLAVLTPNDVTVRFYDDRMEEIPFDEPTDLVAISVETYTAKRAYQIASEYRRRKIPVVMGGFHATLVGMSLVRLSSNTSWTRGSLSTSDCGHGPSSAPEHAS